MEIYLSLVIIAMALYNVFLFKNLKEIKVQSQMNADMLDKLKYKFELHETKSFAAKYAELVDREYSLEGEYYRFYKSGISTIEVHYRKMECRLQTALEIKKVGA